MLKGKLIVYFLIALAMVLTGYLVIFQPGPMSAEKVAHAKQRAIFGEEEDFRILQEQLATMSQSDLDSAIALFNQLIRVEDTLKLVLQKLTSSTVTDLQNRWTFPDLDRLKDRKKVMTAYVDLLSGRLKNGILVDSLAVLTGIEESYRDYDSTRVSETSDEKRPFDRIHSQLYGDLQ